MILQVTVGNYEMGGGEALGSDSDGAASENQNEVQKSNGNATFEVRPGLAVESSIFDQLLSARKLELLNDPVSMIRCSTLRVPSKIGLMAKQRRKNSCFSCSSCRKYRPC